MRNVRQNTGIWQYLAQCGVLENGTDDEIKAARKAYWQKYFREYKRKRRAEHKEITVFLQKEDLKKISEAAKNHKLTKAKFLKEAAAAYVDKAYIVPDRVQVAYLEQMLIQILNEIQAMAKRAKILHTINPSEIENRISRMEYIISDTLRNPHTLEEYINSHPELKGKLILLNNDCQSQNPQNTQFPTTAQLHSQTQ